MRRIFSPDQRAFVEVPVYDLDALQEGHHFTGPALAEGRHTTAYVTAAFDGAVDAAGSLLIRRKGTQHTQPEQGREEPA